MGNRPLLRQGNHAGHEDRPLPCPCAECSWEALGLIFDSLNDGMLLLDGQNRILGVNSMAERLLRRPCAELMGLPLAEVVRHDEIEELLEGIRANGCCQATEIYVSTLPGPGHLVGVALQDNTNRPSRLLLVLRDVTRLRHLETAGEEYATNVSHELKTPLTLILGYAETLLTHKEADATFRHSAMETIQRHAKRIIRIVDDLMRLAWLRNESETTGIPRTPTAVAGVLDNAAEICRAWAANASISIETRAPPGLVWLLNPGLVEEAVINLVKNAILYSLKGPVEVVACVTNKGRMEIRVEDCGPGLKPEDANRIFDRFYRVDKGRARTAGGSGLGLPIVQQIVEAHGGTARVESTPGAGCTFILEFPDSSVPAGR